MTTHAIRFSGTAPIVAIAMTARLDPETALAYLRSLHTDVLAAAVIGPAGEVLAGDRRLAGRSGLPAVAADGLVVVVEPAPHAAERLLLSDMRAALEALAHGR